ncbi:putative choline transporter, neither null mutation nor overexpression affects choline transport, partial [Nowakowskiella sp. JEL0078]
MAKILAPDSLHEGPPPYQPLNPQQPSVNHDEVYRVFIDDLLAPEDPPAQLPPRVRNLELKYFNTKPKYQAMKPPIDEFSTIDKPLDKLPKIPEWSFSLVHLALLSVISGFTTLVVYGSFGLILSLFGFLAAVFIFYYKQVFIGLMCLFTLATFLILAIYRKNRVRFTIELLKSVTNVASMFPGMAIVGGSALVVQALWGISWILLLTASLLNFLDWNKIAEKMENEKDKFDIIEILRFTNLIVPTFLYFGFSLNWTSQIINNVVYVTVSGVYSTFFYLSTSQPSGEILLHSQKPTAKSLKRALTTSFGSIVFGSLIITVAEMIVAIFKSSTNRQGNVNGLRLFIACCFEQIFRLIRDLLEFLNRYAFVQVATFGKSYIEAAKDTWQLIKFRGLDLVINDSLTNSILALGGFYSGLITSGITYLLGFVVFAHPEIMMESISSTESTSLKLLMVFSFFIGFVQFMVLAGIIKSGMATTFVCLAQDPQILAERQPALYSKIQETYSTVMLENYSTQSSSEEYFEDYEEISPTNNQFSGRDGRGRY